MFEFPGGEVQGNAQRFATSEEAHMSAQNRFMSWTMPVGFHVDKSTDSVNYKWDKAKGDIST